FAERDARCGAAAAVARALGDRAFIPHPYPVTPYHDDYVAHVDLVQQARERAPSGLPRVRAGGALGAAVAAAGVPRAVTAADATLEEVELSALLAPVETRLLGWTGPPWLKEGWYHAWLLSQSVPAARKAAEDAFRRRTDGGWSSAAERLNLERRLVGQLSADCQRLVLGYTLRREPVNTEYSEGVENVAADAQRGLGSPIFVRTVKLKDFPWNGWLRVAVPAPARAAWNPVTGFGDAAGRMVWAAVGDPALLLDPDSGRFVANRARPQSVGEVTEAPADALDPATLKPVGAGVAARTKVVYRVLLSNAHDGQRLGVPDVLYPYVFAAAWAETGKRQFDPDVERATAQARRALVAVRVTGVAKEVNDLGDMQLMYDVPTVEVYLKPAVDSATAAALVPPWSPVSWPVLALMEQAVTRGIGAFSEHEARRRGVPWLDPVRDPQQRAGLSRVAAELERTAWVPEALRGMVAPEEARRRWAALREFARTRGHFLPTAGPCIIGRVAPA